MTPTARPSLTGTVRRFGDYEGERRARATRAWVREHLTQHPGRDLRHGITLDGVLIRARAALLAHARFPARTRFRSAL
ncbi:hypothetical protein SRB17_02660 [Streptomyces sp. RB17]|uniref:hypothetical protein n=1 Tax=Streptomyces sp. RB17 TaxID=2585197 RepID=UPI001294F633|nr:hypothetical protein [Streptomyces sp. RB17]MQY32318.1 hypothetical protein [Streptomyces sp. RB17]